MAEVIEIQIQDKGTTAKGGNASGSPRPPSGGGAANEEGGNGNGKGKPAGLLGDLLGRVWNTFKGKIDETAGGKPLRWAEEMWKRQATEKTPPQPPSLPQRSAGEGAGAAESAAPAAAGVAEGTGAAAAEGGAVEGAVGGAAALDAATGGLATPFIVAVGAAAAAVGVAALAFDAGMHIATDELKVFGIKLASASDDLAAFSPQLSGANAMADVRSLMDDMKEANAVGPDLARIAESQSDMQHELREMFLPIKAMVADLMADLMEDMRAGIKLLAQLAEAIFKWMEENKGLTETLKETLIPGYGIIKTVHRLLGDIEDNTKKEAKYESLFLDMLHANKVSDEQRASSVSRRADWEREHGGPHAPIVDLIPNP